MLSRVQGRNYIVRLGDDRYPLKVNKKKTDAALKKIVGSLQVITDTIKELYNSQNGDLLYLLGETAFYRDGIEIEDGKCYALEDILSEIAGLQEQLATHQDDIPSEEELLSMEDLGYKKVVWSRLNHVVYEKVLENSKEKEVTEEIQYIEGKVNRLVRTTYWEYKPGCKSSKDIRYKKLRVIKKIKEALKNSLPGIEMADKEQTGKRKGRW